MTTVKHYLEVYEPYSFDGSNPAVIIGNGILRGGNGAFYYLVELVKPCETSDIVIQQLLLLPRYLSDSISRAQQSACTVNIERVLPGIQLLPNQAFSYNDIEHWGVGKITPCH